MQAKLRAYMDHLFSQTRPTKAAVELKEEMLQRSFSGGQKPRSCL